MYLHQHQLFGSGIMDVEPAVRHCAVIAALHTGKAEIRVVFVFTWDTRSRLELGLGLGKWANVAFIK